MQAINISTENLEKLQITKPTWLICIADEPDLLPKLKDSSNIVNRLDLIFTDNDLHPPTEVHIEQILTFAQEAENLIISCQVGVGRSLAVLAALYKIGGIDPFPLLARGTHNRLLYQKLLIRAGIIDKKDPLVSIVVRVKYPADRLNLFLLSMQRQRYKHWECICVTDGPNSSVHSLIDSLKDYRIKIIKTPVKKGRWGHPYRQLGIDSANGEYIGLSNDDNYYCPGYIEQMVNALSTGPKLAICQILHAYQGWAVVPDNPKQVGLELGNWIAHKDIIKQNSWTDIEFNSDVIYLKRLTEKYKFIVVPKPLFCKN